MNGFVEGFKVIVCAVGYMCAASSSLAAQSGEQVARRAALDQANVEYGLQVGLNPRAYGESDFAVQLVRAQDSVRVYRVVFQFSENRHPYTVMMVGDRVYRLGGFTAPELIRAGNVWRVLGLPTATEERAIALASLADRNGSQRFLAPAIDTTSGEGAIVRARWGSIAPSTWPRDTVVADPSGAMVVTFTVFSKAAQDFVDGWDPVLYRMAFDESGDLVAWASRSGSRFSAP